MWGGGGGSGRSMGPLTGGRVGGSPCRMSILRNAYVACLCRLFVPLSHVEFKKLPCRMSNLRNGPVAMSILGV